MPTPIAEYLVRLGFEVDKNELKKFNDSFKETEKAAAAAKKGLEDFVITTVKWQAALTTAFIGVGIGIAKLIDDVAQQDQSFRLFGLRMNMTKEHARSLKTAMDALGASLEEIAWDPELHGRLLQSIEDQKQLDKALGANFDQQMREVRDVRWELSRMGIELQRISWRVVSDLLNTFGTSFDGLLQKLRDFNAWVIQHVPEISEFFVKYLVPILKETWEIAKETATVFEDLAVAFTNVVGALSGDSSLESSTFKFESLAGAIQHVVGWMGSFVHAMVSAEQVLAHLVSGVAALFSGRFDVAGEQFKALGAAINLGSGAILGGAGGSAVGGAAGALYGMGAGATLGSALGPLGTIAGGALGGLIGGGSAALVGGGVGTAAGGGLGWLYRKLAGDSSGEKSSIAEMIVSAAKEAGIDPRLALSVANQESGLRQFDSNGRLITSSAGAMGVMQLMGATAKGLGVDPADTGQNIKGGTQYLATLLKQFNGDPTLALEAYNWGPANVERALRNHTAILPAAQQYAAGIERNAGVSIGDIHVHVGGSTNASAGEIGHEVKRQVRDLWHQEIARTSAQYAY